MAEKITDAVFNWIDKEKKRQSEGLELIPSENYVSENVLKAKVTLASVTMVVMKILIKSKTLRLNAQRSFLMPTTQTCSHTQGLMQMRQCTLHGASRAIRFWQCRCQQAGISRMVRQ